MEPPHPPADGTAAPKGKATAHRKWSRLGPVVAALVLVVGGLALFSPLPQLVLVQVLNSVETTTFEVRGQELWMNGEINSKTYDQFIAVMEANPDITTLVEEEVPGSLDDDTMIKLAYKVRELQLDTRLLSNSAIDSGGVDLFLAGVNRTMEDGAHIGVHSWSDGRRDAADYPRDSPEHESNRKYIEDMLGSDEFYWFTIYAAPADGIHPMTNAEIETYGLLTEPIRAPAEG